MLESKYMEGGKVGKEKFKNIKISWKVREGKHRDILHRIWGRAGRLSKNNSKMTWVSW